MYIQFYVQDVYAFNQRAAGLTQGCRLTVVLLSWSNFSQPKKLTPSSTPEQFHARDRS